MDDLKRIIDTLPVETKIKVLPALKILADSKLFSLIARANANQLVDGRMDSEDELAIVQEVREHRQTNRILLGFEELVRDLTKGIEDA
jgi:hypothetical protein